MSVSANQADGPQAEKRPLNLTAIMLGIMVVLVLVLSAKLFLGESTSGAKAPTRIELGESLPLDEFLVNVNGVSGAYLKATVVLALKKGVTREQVKEQIPAMRDATLSVLQAKSYSELNAPERRDVIKEEIRARIDREVAGEPVAKVYFTQFATK